MIFTENLTQTNKEKAIQAFLYLLIRDHVPTGIIHEIIMDLSKTKYHDIIFTNKFLAEECAVLTKAILTSTTFKELMYTQEKSIFDLNSDGVPYNDPKGW